MAASNFSACLNTCLPVILQWEGGFVDNPHDPGGATYRGVTQATYNAYRNTRGLPPQSVRDMSDAECSTIYETEYWIPARCNNLPAGVDLCQFDEAVNCGNFEATKLLQQALGVSADGIFGLQTLAAVQRCRNIPALINKLCALRLSYYHRLKTWIFFGVGWTRRDTGIQVKALSMFYASQKATT